MTTATADLEAALLADVLRDPSDDTPRMALADVLQERGDPRGEFVAVQLVLDRLRAESGAEMRRKGQHAGRPCRHTWPEKCASCRDLGRRERELFKAGANFWCWFPDGERTIVDLREPPDAVVFCHGPGAPGLTVRQHFHRGLVSEITLTLADFTAHAAALGAAAPVTAVRLADREPWANGPGYVSWLNAECFAPRQSNPNAERAKVPGRVFMAMLRRGAGTESPSGRSLRFRDGAAPPPSPPCPTRWSKRAAPSPACRPSPPRCDYVKSPPDSVSTPAPRSRWARLAPARRRSPRRRRGLPSMRRGRGELPPLPPRHSNLAQGGRHAPRTSLTA
jgi:uncharacterized protein (TIGR02996 family)